MRTMVGTSMSCMMNVLTSILTVRLKLTGCIRIKRENVKLVNMEATTIVVVTIIPCLFCILVVIVSWVGVLRVRVLCTFELTNSRQLTVSLNSILSMTTGMKPNMGFGRRILNIVFSYFYRKMVIIVFTVVRNDRTKFVLVTNGISSEWNMTANRTSARFIIIVRHIGKVLDSPSETLTPFAVRLVMLNRIVLGSGDTVCRLPISRLADLSVGLLCGTIRNMKQHWSLPIVTGVVVMILLRLTSSLVTLVRNTRVLLLGMGRGAWVIIISGLPRLVLNLLVMALQAWHVAELRGRVDLLGSFKCTDVVGTVRTSSVVMGTMTDKIVR